MMAPLLWLILGFVVFALGMTVWYSTGIDLTVSPGALWSKHPNRWAGRWYEIVTRIVEVRGEDGEVTTLEDTSTYEI